MDFRGLIVFDFDVDTAAKQHARAEWPYECVGYVVDNVYVPQKNVASDPLNSFKTAEPMPDDVQAIIHSHAVSMLTDPVAQSVPSADDMASQFACAVPFGIIAATKNTASEVLWFGDHVLDQPLIGRKFVPNVTDCYELMRAYAHQKYGAYLRPVPREALWWERKQNVLADNFRLLGFTQIDPKDAREGDGLLISIPATSVVNHCAVLIEGGLMLHHRIGELSRREPWSGAWRRLTRAVVRKDWGAAQ